MRRVEVRVAAPAAGRESVAGLDVGEAGRLEGGDRLLERADDDREMVDSLAALGKPLAVQALALERLDQLELGRIAGVGEDRKSTRLNSSHVEISYAVFCLKKKKNDYRSYACSTNTGKQ